MTHKIYAFLHGVCRLAWRQLPLFVMLVAFATIPARFGEMVSPTGGAAYLRSYIVFLLPQTILTSLLLCWVADRRRWLWYTVFTIASLLFFIELGCFFCQHTRFNTAIAILMLQTNGAETKEFFDFAMVPVSKAAGCSVVIAAIFLCWARLWRRGWAARMARWRVLNNQVAVCVVGTALTLSVVYTPLRLRQCVKGYYWYYMRMSPMLDASTTVVYWYALMDTAFNPEIRQLENLAETIEAADVDMSRGKDELEIVYVIGESFGRSRSSLYGYPMETNPRMSAEMADSALIIFDNVVTHSPGTHEVYRCMLSTYDLLGTKKYADYPLLPAILRKAGYRVAYYDNQSVLNSVKLDFGCASFLSDKTVQQQSIDYLNEATERYDGTFVATYPPIGDSPRSMTIYHLMGQHVGFANRYPADFAKFTRADYAPAGCYTDQQADVVAQYDNATLYNDYVLSKIIDSLRDKVAIMVYAPDHGEEIYDYRDVTGRYVNYPDESIRLLYEIPAMIWVSDKYRELYPHEVEMLRQNIHKAIYNSDLPHTILDMAGVETQSFSPGLSLLRSGTGRTDRRLLRNNYNYDANRHKLHTLKLRYEN